MSMTFQSSFIDYIFNIIPDQKLVKSYLMNIRTSKSHVIDKFDKLDYSIVYLL